MELYKFSQKRNTRAFFTALYQSNFQLSVFKSEIFAGEEKRL